MNRVVSYALKFDGRDLGYAKSGVTRKMIILLCSLVITAFWGGLIYFCCWVAGVSIDVPLFLVALAVIFLVSRLCLSVAAIASKDSGDDDLDNPPRQDDADS
jgi:hypothetical protein